MGTYKFEIGELAEAYWVERGIWVECTILKYDDKIMGDYYINVPDRPNLYYKDDLWRIQERRLRKKKPPQELGKWEDLKDIWIPSEHTISVVA